MKHSFDLILDRFIYINFKKTKCVTVGLFEETKVVINIDKRNQAVNLISLIWAVSLAHYLDLWARKCSIVVFIVIVNIILIAHLEQLKVYLEPCQISTVGPF